MSSTLAPSREILVQGAALVQSAALQPMSGLLKARCPINSQPVHNRLRRFLEHSTRYAFMGEVRLARDCQVSCAAISRLLAGKSSPSFALVSRIAQALEAHFHRPLDPREIISLSGHYPTATVCELVGCRGCTPEAAWTKEQTLKAEFVNADLKQASLMKTGGAR